MVYDYRDALITNSSDANFRSWATALHDMLIAIGLVQTSDTGQVNRTTMVVPASSAFAGYEIFRFNDSLQGTKPIFLKVEYGAGSPVGSPNVRFTVGPSTNGAGTLGSSWGGSFTSGGTNSTTLPQACFASGDGSSFMLSMWAGYAAIAGTSFQFFIERSRDENGDPTGDGLAFGMSASVRVLAWGGTWSTSNFASLFQVCPLPSPDSTGATVVKGITDATGDILYWLPCIFSCPSVPPWRSKLMVGVHTYDAGIGSTFDAAVHGGDEVTYLQPGALMPGTGIGTYANNISTNYDLAQYWVA